MAGRARVTHRLGVVTTTCQLCGGLRPHTVVASGVARWPFRRRPVTDIRHYAICTACGARVPATRRQVRGARRHRNQLA